MMTSVSKLSTHNHASSALIPNESTEFATTEGSVGLQIPLHQFIAEFGDGLLEAVERECPPVFSGLRPPQRDRVMDDLKRQPFDAQRETVHAATTLLLDRDEQACILNCEMGTGKTMMAICAAAVLHSEGYRRTLVLSPPHLVYKWRREILDTVKGASVWVLNGPDTLSKLLRLRELLGVHVDGPEFFILGRVRMRMGFHWRTAFQVRHRYTFEPIDSSDPDAGKVLAKSAIAVCPDCAAPIVLDDTGIPVTPERMRAFERRIGCAACDGRLWTLMRPRELKSR